MIQKQNHYRFEINKTTSVLTDSPKLWNSLPHETRTAYVLWSACVIACVV